MHMIDRVKAHFHKLADVPKEIRVTEWEEDGGDPCLIYISPLTLKERATIERLAKNNFEYAVEAIILKAKDKDGKPIFTREHKQDFMRAADSGIVLRLAREISGLDMQELAEEAEKN